MLPWLFYCQLIWCVLLFLGSRKESRIQVFSAISCPTTARLKVKQLLFYRYQKLCTFFCCKKQPKTLIFCSFLFFPLHLKVFCICQLYFLKCFMWKNSDTQWLTASWVFLFSCCAFKNCSKKKTKTNRKKKTKKESFNKYISDEWAAIIFFLSGSWVPLYTT